MRLYIRPSFKCSFLVTALFLVMSNSSAFSAADDLGFFSPYPFLDKSRWFLSDGWTNGDHQSCEWRANAIFAADGKLRLRLSDQGGEKRPFGCAEIQSKSASRFGRYEARLRAASGSGLNTAFFTYVGPPSGGITHDEIDFEFLGKNPRSVEVTYWTGGRKHDPFDVSLPFDASAGFHDYAFEWTSAAIRWYVDGKLVHETPKGADIPDHQSRIYVSLWSGSAIEDSWMGPFHYKGPVTADVAWVKHEYP